MLSINPTANSIENFSNLTENQILDLAITALKKQSSQRTTEDINLLKKTTENNPFFSTLIEKYGEETYSLIFQNLTYQYVEPDTVLFESGSIGTTFYILLKGTMSVIIKIGVTLDDGTFEYDYKEVKVMMTGDSFGELAIMEEILKPRAATIKAIDECHLACLNRTSYKKILGLHQKRELDTKIEFLSSIPVFKSWSNHSLKTLTYLMVIKNLSRKQIVYRENDQSDEIYIIRSGELKSLKTVRINHKEKESEQLLIDEQNQIYTYSKDPFIKNVEIAVMTEGQIFGEEEAYILYKKEKAREKSSRTSTQKDENNLYMDNKYQDITRRETTVIVYSQHAEIWCVNKKNFFQKLEPYAVSYNLLVDMINKKTQWRNDRLNEITKSASSNINYLIGNSPIKAKPSQQNDIITTIKFKQFKKNPNQTIVKTNPVEIEMIKSESYSRLKDTKSMTNTGSMSFKFIGNNNNQSINDGSIYDHLTITDNLDNFDGISFHGKMITNRSKTTMNRNAMNSIYTFDDKSILKMNTTINGTFNYNSLNDDSISHKRNLLNSASKKVLIAENPNLKFWDIKLDIISTSLVPSNENESVSRFEKPAISSVVTRPVYHDPQDLLAKTMSTKQKIQEKLKNTSFASKTSYYTAMREYNQFNLALIKRPLKSSSMRDTPNQLKEKKKKCMNCPDSEAKSFERLVQALKSRPKFIRLEQDSYGKEDRNSFTGFSTPSKRNIRGQEILSHAFQTQNIHSHSFEGSNQWLPTGSFGQARSSSKPMATGYKTFPTPERLRALSVNGVDAFGNIPPLVQLSSSSNHVQNIHVNLSRSHTPANTRFHNKSQTNGGDISLIKEAMSSDGMMIMHKSKLIDRRARSAIPDQRNYAIHALGMNNQHYGHGYKQENIYIPGLGAIIKKFGDKQKSHYSRLIKGDNNESGYHNRNLEGINESINTNSRKEKNSKPNSATNMVITPREQNQRNRIQNSRMGIKSREKDIMDQEPAKSQVQTPSKNKKISTSKRQQWS